MTCTVIATDRELEINMTISKVFHPKDQVTCDDFAILGTIGMLGMLGPVL